MIRSPMVMNAYFENEEATKTTIDYNGFINTGDVVQITDTGLIKLVGRQKVGGSNRIIYNLP